MHRQVKPVIRIRREHTYVITYHRTDQVLVCTVLDEPYLLHNVRLYDIDRDEVYYIFRQRFSEVLRAARSQTNDGSVTIERE